MPPSVPSAVVPQRPATAGPAPTLIAAAALSTAFVALTLLVTLRWSTLMAFDRERLVQLRDVDARSTPFLDVMRLVSEVLTPLGWAVVLGALAVWFVARRRLGLAAFIAVTDLGSWLLNAVLKELVDRPRPVLIRPVDVASGSSFPSSHTQAATVGCGVLLVVFLPSLSRVASRWAVAAAVGVVVLVALSRMALGVHYPSDVAASVLFGSAWTSLTTWVFLRVDASGHSDARSGSAGG